MEVGLSLNILILFSLRNWEFWVGLKNVLGVGFEQLNIWFSIIVSQLEV